MLSLCAQHPVPPFQYWAFSDIQTGRVLTKVTDESSGCGKAECAHLGGSHDRAEWYFSAQGAVASRSMGELVWGLLVEGLSLDRASSAPRCFPVSLQLSPVLSSTRTGSFLGQGRWTLRSRSGI